MPRELPGITARHAIISPSCREMRGDEGALEEALDRLRDSGRHMMESWPLEKMRSHGCKFHLVLSVEYRRGSDPEA